MNELFSILIANHNRAKYLTECINSILNQTYKNWEVIFVDDCSSDNSVEVFTNLTANDNRFHLFQHNQNKGCGYTKKECVDRANGTICGFLDSDDILTTDALELMVKLHTENAEVSIAGSRKFYCDENMKIYDVDTSIAEAAKKFTTQLEYPFFISHFATFKKSAYLKTSGIDPYLQKAVDQDLYYKLEEQGKVSFIDKPLYYYRHSGASISLFNNVYKADAWHLCVIFEVCKRRGLNFNDYCSLMKKTKSRKEKLINLIFQPYQNFKENKAKKNNLKAFTKEAKEHNWKTV